MNKSSLIVGLDVGTTKTRAVVGEVVVGGKSGNGFYPDNISEDSGVNIIGVGNSPSDGIKKGVVVNIDRTAESIKKAVEDVEAMANIEVEALHVGISGDHISSFLSHGVIALKEKEINQKEIDRVVEAAKTVAIPLDRETIQAIPEGFVVDGQNGISDPRGMSGVRLETHVRIITGSLTPVKNLIKSCQKAGFDVINVVFEPLASAEAVLSREEKELGVGLVDIGGGTTDIALFHEGNICYTSVLNVGGSNFTNDTAIGLRVPASEAEKIKIKHGCAMMSMITQDEEIEVNYTGDRPSRKIPRQHLIEVLQPRAEELFYLVKKEMTKSGFHKTMVSGIVLTGGAALMQGIDVMAENILELPVRIGKPKGIKGIADIVSSPVYAAAVGLVFCGAKEALTEYRFTNGGVIGSLRARMGGLIKFFNNKLAAIN